MNDNVNHPSHYTTGAPCECIEITRHYSFCIGNAIKYVWRHNLKGKPLEDLKKAEWYLTTALCNGETIPAPVHDLESCVTLYRNLMSLWFDNFAGAQVFWFALRKQNIPQMLMAVRAMIGETK